MFFYINTVSNTGGGGEIPYKNDSGACGKFSKNILAVPEYRLIGVAQIQFLPLRSTNFKQQKTHTVFFFSLAR